MKSIYLYIIAFMAASFTLTACDKSDDNKPSQQQVQPPTSPDNPGGGGDDTPSGGDDNSGGGDDTPDDKPKTGIDDVHNEQTDQPAYVKASIDI